MTITGAFVRAAVLEQTARTRHSSKPDIQRFIEDSEQKITSLESQISTLVELRDRERACVHALRYIVSPIRTLPIELLVEIFRLAIGDETHVEDTYRITQVCSDWRKVAHATPRLWTRPIRVELGDRTVYYRREGLYADGLEAWLARSVPIPVSVLVNLDRATIDPRILEVLLSIAPRVQSLYCANFFPLPIISRLAGCRLDSLEELRVGMAGSLPTPPAFTMAPRLRKFSMTLHSNETQVLVPWAQLTDIDLDSESPDIILDILAQCTALTRVSICTSGWPSSTPPQLTQAPLALNQLHTLSLDVGYPQHVTHFLDLLSGPALRTFHLNFSEMQTRIGQPELESAALTSFLIRSPDITSLDIRCGPQGLASHQLIATLEHTPCLTHLKLAYVGRNSFDDALVDALSYKDGLGAAPLVPHLHDLVLENIDENGFGKAALERMFLSRWWADGEIMSGPPAVPRWSYVGLWGKYSEQFMDSMETLQRKGLPLGLVN
ncbi:hypothetical protein MSAN_01348300 [Mycena sanguinolenta]|uniref:F-box domain-containing protein n=1 Tax=Mycena sanguinolenta TaxID=230812 RepID=A0A8H7D0Z9_9AGAR|nr:hypothetical protein MSAN_01348300 [Mycena sanguinolenta]